MTPVRGDPWLFDLGMAGKVRPALVISVAIGDADRALVTAVPHTTSLRGSPFEIPVSVSFLRTATFVVQGLSTSPHVRAIRKLGVLKPEQFRLVFTSVLRWLGETHPPEP
jgi:mRNA interferase MazF